MAGPWLVGVAIDTSLPDALKGDYTSLTVVSAALLACALASGGLRSVFVLRSGVIGQAVLFDLRCRGFDHMQALSVSFHERFTSGRVISRLTSDVDTLTELLDAGLDGLLTAILNITAISVLLFFLDVPLAAFVIISLVPLFFLFRWFSVRATAAFRRTRETVATLIVNIVETFNGIRAVQAFRREKRNDAIFAGLNDAYGDANRDAFRLHAVFIPGVALVGNVSTVVVLLIGGWRVTDGGLELGVLTAFLLYLRQFYDPMEDVAIFYNSLQSATAALEKIAAVMAEAPSVPEPEQPTPLPAARTRCVAARRHRVRLPRRPSGAARADHRHPGRPDGRAGRRDRCRQDDDRQADLALLRPDQRRGAHRRRRPARRLRARSARGRRHGHPGRLPVLGFGRRQHRLRTGRRQPRRDRGRGPSRRVRTTSSPRCPTATTPTCASAVAGSRPGSGSSSRSRARSSPTRRC